MATFAQQSYWHRGGAEPLLGATIPEHFAAVVQRFPEQEAVVSLPQGRRLSYGELAEQVGVANRLTACHSSCCSATLHCTLTASPTVAILWR